MDQKFGYPMELFLGIIDPNYLCPICLVVIRDPVICKAGHTMCRTCFETALSVGNHHCPVYKCSVSSRPTRNLALDAIINKLSIKCPNGAGCSWNGALEDAIQHKKQCPLEMLGCTNSNCCAKVYRCEMATHQERCPHKSELCTHCTKPVEVVDMVLHLGICPKKSVNCPNNCGENILRDEVISHFDICKFELTSCPFHCGVVLGQETNTERHFLDYSGRHLQIVMEKMIRSKKNKEINPPCLAGKAAFEWKILKEDIKSSPVVLSPEVATKLCAVQCAVKEDSGNLHLGIFVKNTMKMMTLLTSGMVVFCTKSKTNVNMAWEEEVISPDEGLLFKKVANVTELETNIKFSFCIKIFI